MRQKKVVLLMSLALLGLSACGSGNNASSTATSVPASSAPTSSTPTASISASASSSVMPVALAAPVITLADNVVSWTAVAHATGYDVYVNDAKLISVTALTYTISETATGSYAIKLKAVSSDTAYSESVFSNVVTYAYVAAIESVAFEMTLPAALNAGNDLYLLGSWDNYAAGVKMTADGTNALLYTVALATLKEQEYTYYVEINNLAKYKETGAGAKATPTVASPKVTHTVASFAATPEYTVTGDLTKAAYKEAEDGSITYANNNWMDGFLLKDMSISEAAYSVSAHFVGTKTSPIAADDFIGVVPYYVDSDNYVIAYARWGTDHTTMMTEVQVTGVIGGTDLGWHDHWADASVATMPADGFTLSVTLNATLVSYEFSGANAGLNTASGSETFSTLVPSNNAKVGIWAQNDTVTVSEFSTALLG